MNYNYSDIAMTSDGDISVGPDGDLFLSRMSSGLAQGIQFRLNTELSDLYLHPSLGNTIKNAIGKRNTKELAEEIKANLISCLTYGNFIKRADITINYLPMDAENIIYHLEVNNGSYVPYVVDLILDLETGMRRV